MTLKIGNVSLETVSGGRFRLDGGAMFGVVPKPLWSKRSEPDELNRIALATNCVLIQTDDLKVIIDTGYGEKLSEKEHAIYEIETHRGLLANLAEFGLAAADINMVIFSHLHFDHAGGGTVHNEAGTIVPAFPEATYCVQQREWDVATSGLGGRQAGYPMENLSPLAEHGQLKLIDGDAEIAPGIRCALTGGHSPGHQLVIVESEGQRAVYMGDLCPTWSHLQQMWCMAYDLDLAAVRQTKPKTLGWLADEDAWVLSDHDPEFAAVRLQRDSKREFVISEARPSC